ncbi:AaceriAAL142Cp [[Ashbya] aceris (nom. inval.)]|nr:AaceriAAL142Cp [[Ashbya] aceris (nom. inval.)]
MERPLWFRWLRVYAIGFGIIGAGVLLFKYTTPTDEELIAALSPELRQQYERERNLRQAEQQELMRIVKKTSTSETPVWNTGPIKSPWERKSLSAESKEQFQQVKAEQVQREELERIRQELENIRQQSTSKTQEIANKKGWWPW